MATIWKRKDRDVWVVDFRDATGRRIRLTAASRQAAEDLLAEKIKASREPVGNVADRDITIQAYADRWLETAKLDLAQRTHRSYTQLFTLHLLPTLGSIKVRELRVRDIKRLLAEKRGKGLAKNTVRLIKAALSTLLTEAVEDELIQANPALGFSKKKKHRAGQGASTDVNPMDHDQVAAFKRTLDALIEQGTLDRRFNALFRLQMGTGLRPNEGLALRPGDLDLQKRTVRVERAVDLDQTTKPTKTEETRLVDLSEALIRHLRDHLDWLHAEAIAAGRREPAWLFPGYDGGVLSERHVREVFERVLRKAELPHFRLYDLRHTYASLLLSEGVPLLYVSKQLGHAKPTTTLKYYAKWIPSGDRRYVDVLDRASEETWHKKLAERLTDQRAVASRRA